MSVTTAFHISVDWRWQRVKELAAAKASPSRSRDDKWVQRARKYQKRKEQINVRTEARIGAAYPAIHLAFKIFDDLNSQFKWIIEAGILAKVSQKELAEYLALTPEVIEAYEKLFFDVREKLDAKGYVLGSILGPAIRDGVNSNDPDGFWKILAFHGGWEHVQGCWCAGKATSVALAYYRTVAVQQLAVKAAAGSLSVHPNSFNVVDVVKTSLEQAQYEEEHGQGGTDNQNDAALHALVNNITVLVRDPRIKLPAEEPRMQLPLAETVYAGDKQKPADD